MSSGSYINRPLLGSGQTSWNGKTVPATTKFRVGLTTNANKASNVYSSFSYALEYNGSNYFIYEPGNGWPSDLLDLGAYAINTPAVIAYDGVKIYYYLNGVAVRTVTVTENQTLYAKMLAEGIGVEVENWRDAPFSNNRWGSQSGAGIPDNNADVTGDNTAAAIIGQAATATSSDFSAITGTTKPEANATYTKNQQAWVASTAYKIGDFVQYGGSSWIAIADHTSNDLYPPGHATNTQFKILAVAGSRTEVRYTRSNATPATPTGNSPAGWTTSIPSTPIDQAVWESRAQKNSFDVVQGTWSIPSKISGQIPRGAYATNTLYYSNDTVTYNGGTYYTLLDNFQNQAPSGTAQANTYWGVLAAPGSQAASGSQTLTLTMNGTANGATQNIRTLADAAGYTGGDLTLTVNISGTYSGPTGGIAIRTGTFPADKTISMTINVLAAGKVYGGPGGPNGGVGGDAFYIEQNVSGGIVRTAGSNILAGGGGGGAGGNQDVWVKDPETQEFYYSYTQYGGSGGTGAWGVTAATAGSAGDTGAGTGGSGGAIATAGSSGTAGTTSSTSIIQRYGQPGGSGGAAGYAVRKNGKTCNVTGSGTITGTVA